jgi:hypothetical protein
VPEPSVEQRVRERAYALWIQAGRPDGRSAEFWQRARDEIEQELLREQDDVIDDKPESF